MLKQYKVDINADEIDKSKGPWKKGKKKLMEPIRTKGVAQAREEMHRRLGNTGYEKEDTKNWDKRKPEIGGYDPELDEG